jgi:hypothetical protein
LNIFNQDFADFINAFENNRVEYVLVGGLAVVLHGYNRTTGDMDILVSWSARYARYDGVTVFQYVGE